MLKSYHTLRSMFPSVNLHKLQGATWTSLVSWQLSLIDLCTINWIGHFRFLTRSPTTLVSTGRCRANPSRLATIVSRHWSMQSTSYQQKPLNRRDFDQVQMCEQDYVQGDTAHMARVTMWTGQWMVQVIERRLQLWCEQTPLITAVILATICDNWMCAFNLDSQYSTMIATRSKQISTTVLLYNRHNWQRSERWMW